MTSVDFTGEEIRLLHAALNSFISDFGHDEADVLHAAQHLKAKVIAAERVSAAAMSETPESRPTPGSTPT
jgi:hypothetical protein